MREEDPATVLKGIVAVLNEGAQANPRMTPANHQRLLRVVGAWKGAVKAWKQSAKAWNDTGRDPSKIPGPPNVLLALADLGDRTTPARGWLDYIKRVFDWHLSIPAGNGRVYVSLDATGENSGDIVAWYFGRLIINSACEKLGGPCPQCKRYYAKRTLRDSEFCSHRCASHAAQTRRNARLHEAKLEAAMHAIKNYRGRPKKYAEMGWKEWVALATEDYFPQDEISLQFLTRAVNNGELRPPTEKAR